MNDLLHFEAAPPTARMPLDADQLHDLWDHAALLFDNFSFCAANRVFKRLLKQPPSSVATKAKLWANVGLIHAHLAEYDLARHALAKAAKLEPSCSVIWYCLGCVSYELEDYRRANKFFKACEYTFAPGTEDVDYSELGFQGDTDRFREYRFVLNRTQLKWNAQQCSFRYQNENHGESLPQGWSCGINRIPGGYIFRLMFHSSPI